MGKVHILDTTLANRIAAGEVVERPSGVVKELIENSIDAGATRIEVMIQEGGISEIQVIDNGSGMGREDATLAFERHATSKIQKDSDLWNIHTLGFRGEALPSIASVSEVELISCDGNESTRIKLNNGKTELIETAAMRKGTQIIVRNLFYTIPARLKHLKSAQYEAGQILDIVQKLALGNPNIAFILRSDNKEIFRSSGNGDLSAVLYSMYGKDVANAAVSIKAEDDDFEINGLVCLPTQTRSTRKSILFFMNNRIVVSYYLQAAIMNAYEEFIPEKRFPMVFININMDSNLVDVNVHPSKWEVRLSKEKQLFALLEDAVRKALQINLNLQGSLLSDLEFDDVFLEKEKVQEQTLFTEYKSVEKTQKDYGFLLPPKPKFESTNTLIVENSTSSVIDFNEILLKNDEKNQKCGENVEKIAKNVEKECGAVENEDINVEKNSIDVENVNVSSSALDNSSLAIDDSSVIPFEVIGQLHGSYILASNADGLVIIDQHAANERIKYEKVRKLMDESNIEVQQLLLPLVITIKNSYMFEFDKIKDNLLDLGIDVDRFGDNELIIREIPTWMNDLDDESQYILDLIELIINDSKIELTSLKKHALATLACHSSVRFNRSLSKYEMEETIKNLFKCENPYHCPHGRPTYVVYENSKLRKLFERT